MRTDDEIVARIDELMPSDFFGFETQDLLVRLPFDRAKKYLKEGARAVLPQPQEKP